MRRDYSGSKQRRDLRHRLQLLVIVLALFGWGCAVEMPAFTVTPEVIVVVVSATPDSPAPPQAKAETPSSTMDAPANTVEPTITQTSTSAVPTALADKGVDINCRFGPGPEFAVNSYFLQGESSQVYGRNEWSTWVQIQDPRRPANQCWVDVDFVSLNVPMDSLSALPTPAGFVYEISLTLREDVITALGCVFPVQAHFDYVIKVSGPAAVKHQITTSVTGGVVREDTFAAFAEIAKDFPLHLHAAGDFWVKVEIMSPNKLSRQVTGEVVCP